MIDRAVNLFFLSLAIFGLVVNATALIVFVAIYVDLLV